MDELITTSKPMTIKTGKKIRWIDVKEGITGYLFILPAFVIIGIFGLFPIGFAVYVSMFQWRINPGNYAALGNYVKALDNLTYLLGFWLAVLLILFAIRTINNIFKTAREHNEHPWIWYIPGAVTGLGIFTFIRFLVVLLPEVLAISTKVRGLEKTQELFTQLLGEAWRVQAVVQARNTAFVTLIIGIILAVVCSLYIYKSARNTQYYLSAVTTVMYAGIAGLLGWLTWTKKPANLWTYGRK